MIIELPTIFTSCLIVAIFIHFFSKWASKKYFKNEIRYQTAAPFEWNTNLDELKSLTENQRLILLTYNKDNPFSKENIRVESLFTISYDKDGKPGYYRDKIVAWSYVFEVPADIIKEFKEKDNEV